MGGNLGNGEGMFNQSPLLSLETPRQFVSTCEITTSYWIVTEMLKVNRLTYYFFADECMILSLGEPFTDFVLFKYLNYIAILEFTFW